MTVFEEWLSRKLHRAILTGTMLCGKVANILFWRRVALERCAVAAKVRLPNVANLLFLANVLLAR